MPVVVDAIDPDGLAIDDDAAAAAAPVGPDANFPDAAGPPPAGTGDEPRNAGMLSPSGAASAAQPLREASASAASRMVAPAGVAAPEPAGQELQREAPRGPLSELSMALPPPPPPKNRWAGKPLFRPVALESAVFESGGHTIAIEGVRSVPADESCVHDGQTWPCGVRARAAFRLWLRGRALVCQIPEDEQEQPVMRGRCRLAKQDVGAWLVENGWASAEPGGPYAQAGEAARAAGLGIFGAPPDTSGVADVPDAPLGTSADLQPVMTDQGVDPEPAAGDPRMAFPPPPPAP